MKTVNNKENSNLYSKIGNDDDNNKRIYKKKVQGSVKGDKRGRIINVSKI